MGSLSNLYISQSYQSLIHLATNNTASATLIDLQDGLGNSIGVSVNTGGDLSLSGSLTASLQQGFTYVGNAAGRTTLVSTSSFGGATPAGTISSSAQITALGFVSSSITASSLITASFSGNTLTFTKGDSSTFGVVIPDISGSTINTGSFVTTSSFNSYTASNDSKVNQLIGATGSYATTGSNTFYGTQTVVDDNITIQGTGTLTAPNGRFTSNLRAFSIANDISNNYLIINSVGNSLGLIGDTGVSIEAPTNSVDVTGSLKVTYVGNTGNPTIEANSSQLRIFNPSAAAPLEIANQFGNININAGGGSPHYDLQLTAGLLQPTSSTYQSQNLLQTTKINGSLTASLQEGYAWVGDSTNTSVLVATSSFGGGGSAISVQDEGTILGNATSFNFNGAGVTATLSAGTASITIPGGGGSIDTGSFATTGSNTFTGDQTLIDSVGNFFTISDASGSMLLVGKSYTSASAHLSASVPSPSGSFLNLIFKINNNTADTIISGSGNIFTNPTGPIAGFKRYVGGQNNIYNTAAIPIISSSMGFSPAMNGNIGPGTYTFRGPVSSSAWNLNTNWVAGAVSIGQSAANNAEKLVSGLTFTTNIIPGNLNIVANREFLTSSVTIQGNNINGTGTLNANSSSITFSNNTVADSNFILNNNFYTGSLGQGVVSVNRNLIIGAVHTMTATGFSDAGILAGNYPTYNNNIIGGTTNTLFINATSGSSNNTISNVIVYGNSLIITGSSNISSTNGSAFFGRYNVNDGRRNSTAGTIFAVGTGGGTGAAQRKTGFLIDSGSNTFIEGTLNVSGSSTFAGAPTITGSVTISGSLLSVDRSGNTTNVIIGLNALGMGQAVGQPLAVGNTISVAIGNGAMRYASGSSQNVAIGNNALLITSGGLNFALGSETMPNNTTGASNIAIGVNALNSITTGNSNVSIGNNSGFRNVSGSNNTYIGESAGYNILGGSNVIIGRYQGSSGETFSNNIILADGGGTIEARFDGDWQFYDNVNITGSLRVNGSTSISGSTSLTGSLYIQSASAFPTQIGTSLVTWDATTGQVGQATTATLISSSFSAGEFYSMTTLSGSAGVSASIDLTNTAISNGVNIGVTPSQIYVQNAGTYNIQFSAQCDAFNNADTIWIWFKKNGINISDSASKLIMQNNTAAIMTVNIFDNAVPNDYYEVVWQNNAGHGKLTSDAATGNIPGVPSVIVTVNQVK